MNNGFLTRDEILGITDITIKEVVIPEEIPAWGGKKLCIRQLSRGEQDSYLKRQFGSMSIRQNNNRKMPVQQQVLSAPDIYGHDAWLVVHSACTPDGKLLFTETDIPALNAKSGEAIGWIAQEVLKFSKMDKDVDAIQQMEADAKN